MLDLLILLLESHPVVPLPRQVKISRTNRAVAVAENNTGIADSDSYLLWDRKWPDCDDRESGNKEDEVMRLVTPCCQPSKQALILI
jgi:hypothetical protein